MKADLFQREGTVSVTFNVPQLGVSEEANISYSLERGKGLVKAQFNSKDYSLMWNPTPGGGFEGQLKTPTANLEKVNFSYQRVSGHHEGKLDFSSGRVSIPCLRLN